MLDFEEEDAEREGRREFEGLEELEELEQAEDEEHEDEVRPACRARRQNRFLDGEACVSKRGREADDDCSLRTVHLISCTHGAAPRSETVSHPPTKLTDHCSPLRISSVLLLALSSYLH